MSLWVRVEVPPPSRRSRRASGAKSTHSQGTYTRWVQGRGRTSSNRQEVVIGGVGIDVSKAGLVAAVHEPSWEGTFDHTSAG